MQIIILAVVLAFGIGALARWAVPGPDPMPWLTMAIGFVGVLAGGLVGLAFGLDANKYRSLIPFGVSTPIAAVLVIAYRRLVQHRGITGPDAQRMPTRGFGVAAYRKRLGIDGGSGTASSASDVPADQLKKLGELRDAGLFTAEEFEAKKAQLLARR